MSLDQRKIHRQLKSAVKNALEQCNINTYNYCYSNRYKKEWDTNEWEIIEHVLSNGLYVYTVLCPNCDYSYYSYGKWYDYDIKKEIDHYKPYPHTNYAKSGIIITTVLSPYSLSDNNINKTIRNRDINCMIPDEVERAVLIHCKSREDKKMKNIIDMF